MIKITNIYIKSIILISITALALMIRISYFFNTEYDHPIRGDAAHYLVYAQNIQKHSVFSKDIHNIPPIPDSFWAPGYPFFLSGILKISTEENAYYNILLSQAIVGALITLVTMLLATLFLKNIWVAISGLLVAISPHLISLGSLLLTECLFSFLLLLSLYLTALSLNKHSKLLLLSAAITFGLSYLINPVMFFTPFFIAPFIYFYFSKNPKTVSKKQSLNFTILFLIAFLIIPSTWALRNQLNVPPDSPTSSGRLLINMIIGAHSNYYEIYLQNPGNPNNPAEMDIRNMNGSLKSFLDVMKERIRDKPGHYAYWYFLKKPILLWDWDILMGQGDIYIYPVIVSLYHKSSMAIASYSIMRSLHYWLFTFAILSIIFIIKQPSGNKGTNIIPMMLYITLFYISSIYVLTQSEARYSIPLRPEMYLCAIFFISKVVSYLNTLRFKAKKTIMNL